MSFLGRDIALDILSPTLEDSFSVRQQAPVSDLVFEFDDIAGFARPGAQPINVDIDVGASSILLRIDDTRFDGFGDVSFNGFNGYAFSDPAGFGDIPPIVGVSIRPGATLGVPPQQIFYNDDEIFVNADAIQFRNGDELLLDVAFDPTIAGTEPPQFVQDIARLYEAGLGREAEPAGFNFWIDTFESGALGDTSQRFSGGGQPLTGLEAMAGEFLFSPEFQSNAGFDIQANPQAFVELLYLNILDRPGEAGGVNFWTGQLVNQQISLEQTLVSFAISPENEAGTQYAEDIAVNLTGTEWFVV